jgi:hypothetical protein
MAAAGVPWSKITQVNPVTHQVTITPIDRLVDEYPALRMTRSVPRRWVHNLFAMVDGLGVVFTPIELALAGMGLLVVPWSRRRLRLEIPLLATWAYLAVAALFFFDTRFLLPVAPAVAIWAGAGAAWLCAYSARGRRGRCGAAGIVAMILFVAFAGRQARIEMTRARTEPVEAHKAAGLWLRDHHLVGPVMATAPSVAFYAGQRAVGLIVYAPAAEVAKLGGDMGARWLALSSSDKDLHPSLEALVEARASAPGLRLVASGPSGTDTWVIWEIERSPEASGRRPPP